MAMIRLSTPRDSDRVVAIWRAVADATFAFLKPGDRPIIDAEIRAILPHMPLWVFSDADDRAIGFMDLSSTGHLGALVIDPAYRGIGVGRRLVRHALGLHQVITTDVNEQNVRALGFYQRLGFRPVGRSARDYQGRPYPLVHLRLAALTDAAVSESFAERASALPRAARPAVRFAS